MSTWPTTQVHTITERKEGFYTSVPSYDTNIASTPGFPVFVLWFVFSIIHGNERAAINGEGLGTLVTWMTPGIGGRGLHPLILPSSTLSRGKTLDKMFTQDWSTLLDRQETHSQVHTCSRTSPPLRPPDIIHVISVPRPSLFYLFFWPLFCFRGLYWTQTIEQNGEDLGMRLTQTMVHR